MSKPNLNTIGTRIDSFRFWVQQTLPAVYDDSLSYYELLSKVIKHLNDVGELTNSMIDLWNEVVEWVLNDGLAESVNKRLDEMAQDGTLDQIINEAIFSDLNKKIDSVGCSVYPSNTQEEITTIINSGDYNKIIFKEGTYNIVNMQLSLQNTQEWEFDGKITFFYNSTDNNDVVNINTNDHGLSLKGQLIIDGDHNAKRGITIDNETSDMIDKPSVLLDGIKAINFFSRTMGQGSVGAMVRGGFDTLEVYNCEFNNVSRLAGVGVPGSQGSTGLSVTSFSSNSYVKNLIINNSHVDTITNQESYESSYNVDCDGFSLLAPLENGQVVESTTSISNCTFKDCKGRNIKSQRMKPSINNCKMYRGLEQSIPNGKDIDLQRGIGEINNVEIHYQETPSGGTPFGLSFATITVNSNSQSNAVMSLINGVTINNNVNPSYTIPYVFFIVASNNNINSFIISNVHHTGSGRINRLIHGDLSNVKEIVLQNSYLSWLLTLVNNTGSEVGVKLLNVVEGNPSQEAILNSGSVNIESTNVSGFEDNYSILNNVKNQYLESTRKATFYNANGNSDEALQVMDYLNQDKVFGVRGSGVVNGKSYVTADYFNNFFIPWAIKTTTGAPYDTPLKQDGSEAIGVPVYHSGENRLYFHVGGGVWDYIELQVQV